MRKEDELAQNTTPIRDVTRSLFESLILDEQPTPAGIHDFGIASVAHYGALQQEVRSGRLSIKDLDEACGCGPALTKLIATNNPYLGVVFQTGWDSLLVPIKSWGGVVESRFPLGRLFASPEALKVATLEEIQEALVRHSEGDWGEGDTAGDESAIRDDGDIVSQCSTGSGGKIFVRTSGNPPMTLVSLDEEFDEEDFWTTS